MHIHGNPMIAASLYFVANSQKATAAERAAAVRKRLLKRAAGVDEPSGPEETTMIARWLDVPPGQAESDSEYSPSTSGKDSDFG
ncbi:MAG: hypothetical protein WA802_17615 [Terracidiphilus sp.]